MVPTPGNSWTKRRSVPALARVRPNPSFQSTSHSLLRFSCSATELNRCADAMRTAIALLGILLSQPLPVVDAPKIDIGDYLFA